MTKQPAQLLRRKHQPLCPLDQPEKIARLNLPCLKNLILSKLVDPISKDKRRLQLRQELVIGDRILKLVSHLAHELVTLTRSQHSQLVKLAPTRTRPWSNIRRLRDEVQQAKVGHLLRPIIEPVADDDSRHWINVQLRDPFPKLGGHQFASVHLDHLLAGEKLENLSDLALDQPRPILVGIEGPAEERVQSLLGLRIARSHGGQYVRSQNLLNGQLRPELLRLRDHIVLHQPRSEERRVGKE